MEIDRLGLPNEEPEDKRKKSLQERIKEIIEIDKKNPEDAAERMLRLTFQMLSKIHTDQYRRTYRPVRLHITPYERRRLTARTPEDKERVDEVFNKMLGYSEDNPNLLEEIIEDFSDRLQDQKKIKKTRAQLTPLTLEEVEVQDVESTINLVKTEKTMSGKINLVEKLNAEQLDTLRQRDPGFETVITGLAKRPSRKQKAQSRILDIYQRRGEDGRRP
jgi:hypothetical protein